MDAESKAAPPAAKRKPALNSLSDVRLAREWNTMTAMIACYCRDHHNTAVALCPACQELQDYAQQRLERCRFGPEKPTCANCPVHCYQKSRRDEIKAVMRYAGPRMLWQHPILSLRHWLDGFRKAQCAGDAERNAGGS
jgi:hypothetical protein